MILLSVIMGMASLQLLKEAVGKIVSLYSGSMPPPTVDYITISIAGFTIGGLLLERGWMVYKLLVRSTLKFLKKNYSFKTISSEKKKSLHVYFSFKI